MEAEDRRRVVIENIKPEIDCGRFPIKRVVGEKVVVTASIFADGHDALSARLLHKKHDEEEWREAPMRFLENDKWIGEFIVEEIGVYHYLIEGWIDHFKTWQRDLKKRLDAGQPLHGDFLIGAKYVEKASERASTD